MKYIVLLMALVNVPFFPNPVSTFAFGFSLGVFVAMVVKEIFDD